LEGESKDKRYEKSIDVSGWAFGATQDASIHQGSGGGTGKVSIHDVQIVKAVDKSTPELLMACCKGTHFKEAKLIQRKAGEKPMEYVILTMEDVLIAHTELGYKKTGATPTEAVTLHFAKFTLDYHEQRQDGGKSGKVTCKWDIPANQAA